jgi:hypothetical protein
MTNFVRDYIVMLLSTDWFLDSWRWIGLEVEESIKRNVQIGCRQIVKGMMGNASQYYNISFGEPRKQETVRLLRELLAKSDVGEDFKSRMEEILYGPTARFEDSQSAWLIAELTGHIATRTYSAVECRLPPEIVRTVSERWRASETRLPNFEGLNLSSDSSWDVYIRELTPDLPTTLSDLVLVQLITPQRFFLFWQSMKAELSNEQRAELINWYRDAAKRQSGHDLRLPTWVD